MVVGDALHPEFGWMAAQVPSLAQQFGLEGFTDSIQAWMEYEPYTQYPQQWTSNAQQAQEVHNDGLPIGSEYSHSFSECGTTPISTPCGMSYIYQTLQNQGLSYEQPWRFPNGTIAPNPLVAAASQTWSGAYALRSYSSTSDEIVTQVQNPYWLNFYIAWGEKNLDSGADGIFFDNPSMMYAPAWTGGWGCTGTWEGQGFINYIKANFTGAQLTALGISNPDSFCLKDYIASKYGVTGVYGNYFMLRGEYRAPYSNEYVSLANSSGLMENPLVKAYVLYEIESDKAFNANFTSALDAYDLSTYGKTPFLTFNGYDTWTPQNATAGSIPDGIILSPYYPILYIEENNNIPSPFQSTVATCKTGLAAVDYQKPVWLSQWDLNFVNPFAPNPPPSNISTMIREDAAQDYASGCLRLVPFGTGTPDQWPPSRLVNGSERDSVGAFYHFIESNKDLFTGTRSDARVALVYSVPDVVWNYLPTFGISPTAYMVEAGGWARALEMLHIPYDIVLLGMKDVYNDQNLASLLGQYDVVIAPGADHVSNSDFAALGNYSASGGQLLVTSGFGSYDDWNSQRSNTSVSSVLSAPGTTVVPSNFGFEFQNELQQGFLDSSVLNQLQEILYQSVPLTDRVGTDAPPTVYISPMVQEGSEKMMVNVVNLNYGYNSSADWTIPTAVRFNLTLPYRSNSWTVAMSTPDGSSAELFSYSITGDMLSVTIPNLELWDILTLQPAQQTTTTTITTYLTTTSVSTSFVTTGGSTVRTTEQSTTTLNRTVTATVQGPTSVTEMLGMLALGGLIGAVVAIYAVRRWRFSPTS